MTYKSKSNVDPSLFVQKQNVNQEKEVSEIVQTLQFKVGYSVARVLTP